MLDALHHGKALTAVLLLGLAYQLGNGLSRWVTPRGWLITVFSAGGLVGALLANTSQAAQLISIGSISLGLQLARRALLSQEGAPKIHVAAKRFARVVGFVIAALIPLNLSLGVVVLSCVVACIVGSVGKDQNRGAGSLVDLFTPRSLHILMLIHQAHYFVYAYGIVYLIYTQSDSGKVGAAVVFALGWITYLSAERLWGRFKNRLVFICGHLFVAICLTGIALYGTHTVVVASLWILTGFGGGSVYCITRMAHDFSATEAKLGVWEDIGHVAGVLVAILLVTIASFSAASLAVPGALLALIAATRMLYEKRAASSLLNTSRRYDDSIERKRDVL